LIKQQEKVEIEKENQKKGMYMPEVNLLELK